MSMPGENKMPAQCSNQKDNISTTHSATTRLTPILGQKNVNNGGHGNKHVYSSKQRYEHGILSQINQPTTQIKKRFIDIPESSSGKKNLNADFEMADETYTEGIDDLDRGINSNHFFLRS